MRIPLGTSDTASRKEIHFGMINHVTVRRAPNLGELCMRERKYWTDTHRRQVQLAEGNIGRQGDISIGYDGNPSVGNV